MPEKSADERLNEFLSQHSDKEFVRRILDPSLNVNPVENEDGSVSTHSMSAESDENGDWFVFPTIFNRGDKLERLKNEDGSLMTNQQARVANQKTGEFIPFGKNGKAAIEFSKNYKTKAFLEANNPIPQFSLSDIAVGNK